MSTAGVPPVGPELLFDTSLTVIASLSMCWLLRLTAGLPAGVLGLWSGTNCIAVTCSAFCSGVFNIEGGCYAKVLGLSTHSPPGIHQALRWGTWAALYLGST